MCLLKNGSPDQEVALKIQQYRAIVWTKAPALLILPITIINHHMKKLCPECGDDFIGRSDKRFCSAHCRTTFYNRQNSDLTRFMRNVNNTLRKNRRILAKYNPEGKARVHKSKLAEAGFKFGYCTNTYRTKSGKMYYFCYEQGYLPIDHDYFALVIRQDYVD